MAFSIQPGIWPVMITPWTEDNKPDFKAIAGLANWYVEQGCAGIFSICLSSEMFLLSEQEKLDIARCVTEAVDGRIQVVASGHTADSKDDQYRQIENMMKIPGIGAYVLVSNRMDQNKEGTEVFLRNAREIFERFPEVDFGIYECPAPFKRLLTTEELRILANEGRMVFMKDTCADVDLLRERLAAVAGTPLRLFDACSQSWFDAACHGGAGFSGLMANFHPDLYAWCFRHREDQPEKARYVAHLLTLGAAITAGYYPTNAKYYQRTYAVPMNITSRSVDYRKLDREGIGQVESLRVVEEALRKELGIC